MKNSRKAFSRPISFFLALLTAALLFIPAGMTASAEKPGYTSEEEWEVLRLTNIERNKAGAVPLSTFDALDAAAKVRSDEIVTLFDHIRPDGSRCFTALDGIPYLSAGENIAAGQDSPATVVTAWMNSEGHRANILQESFRHLGAGYTETDGLYYRYWTQMFVGGCSVKSLSVYGTNGTLNLPIGARIEDLGLILTVTCDLHGDTCLPLDSVDYSYDSSEPGDSFLTVRYDGKQYKLPVSFGFSDVPKGKWYFKPVYYVTGRGYFSGTSASTFSPDMEMTRAMFVTVLARVAGADLSGYEAGQFTDVPANKYYAKAAAWAYQNGIVSGTGNGLFSPGASITRQEACLMISKYLKYRGLTCRVKDDSGTFADDGSISGWAKDAVYEIRSYGIISGKPGNLADPKGTATRAEVATMIMRLDESQETAFNLKVDKVDITIEGASGSVKLLQMSDLHLTLTDGTDTPEAIADQNTRGAMFDTEISDGVSRADRFAQFVDYMDYSGADMLAMTGDIIDAPSNGNLNFLKNNLIDKVKEYLFILGNHDWTGIWLGEYQSAFQRAENLPKFAGLIEDGESEIAVRDYDGFSLIAIDNSNDQITSTQYAVVRSMIKSGTPFILLLHVPVDSSDSPSLAEDMAAKWGRPISMGNPATSPNQLTTAFVKMLQSEESTCRAIICGHIHMDHVDSISPDNDTVQYCLGASYEGYARLFDIHG